MEIRLDQTEHRYWLGDNNIPGYSEISKDLGIIKENQFYTEQGREEGIALHKFLLFLAQRKKLASEPDTRIYGRVAGIHKFIRDTDFKIIGGETPMYEPISRYACSPDIFGFIGNWAWVIDAKRGCKLPSHKLQTAAQSLALRANGFSAQKRGCLYLRDNDYHLEEHTDRADETSWRAIVAGYWAKKKYT